jgi:hypothetical protein
MKGFRGQDGSRDGWMNGRSPDEVWKGKSRDGKQILEHNYIFNLPLITMILQIFAQHLRTHLSLQITKILYYVSYCMLSSYESLSNQSLQTYVNIQLYSTTPRTPLFKFNLAPPPPPLIKWALRGWRGPLPGLSSLFSLEDSFISLMRREIRRSLGLPWEISRKWVYLKSAPPPLNKDALL